MYQFFKDTPLKKDTVLNDRYSISCVIGAGSYGIVYLCTDVKTNEQKAIKQLRPSKCRRKTEIELFQNEIFILSRLNHPNMPEFYEAFSSNGHFFYVMSLIEGDSLEDQIFLNKKTFDEKESLALLSSLVELIRYLHASGICHQDLRIPNILVKNKELFLIDFGLATQRNSALASPFPSSSLQEKRENDFEQQDYYDIGEILLYLLYTTFSSSTKKALPWTEELSLKKETVYLLKRLLGIKKPYSTISEVSADLHTALKASEKAYSLLNKE